MRESNASRGRMLRIGVIAALALLSLALLAGLGVYSGMDVQADEAENASPRVAVRPQIGAMASTAVATVSGTVPVSVSGTISGSSGNLPVTGSADVTTEIAVSTDATLPVTVTVSGSVPFAMTSFSSVLVEGGSLVDISSAVTGVVTINEELWLTTSDHYTQVIIEGVPLHGSLTIFTGVSTPTVVTATGSGPVSGQNALTAEEEEDTLALYLPSVFKNPVQEGYFDNFDSYAAGIWITGDNGTCKIEYHDGHYRFTIRDNWSGSSYECAAITRNPSFQRIGTIGVEARRESDYDLWYGMYFSASNQAQEDSWKVMVRPTDDYECDYEYQPYLWLNCREDGDACWDNKWSCTWDIDIDKGDWNSIDVTRNGDDAKVYINGDDKISKTSGALSDLGYFNLFAISEDDSHTIVVEFDNFYAVPQVLDID
jgi:hypothetical protein